MVWVRHRGKKSPPKSEPLQQTANAKAPKSAGKLLLLAAEPEVAASAASARTNPTPLTTTVVTILRLGPHQICRPVALPAAESEVVASSIQDRAKDILLVVSVSGLLFGLGCGALTAASMYLVWSLLASTCASGYDDDVNSDDEDQLSDSESPKKAGYVIIHDADEYGAGKN